jgi:hypothetical protein
MKQWTKGSYATKNAIICEGLIVCEITEHRLDPKLTEENFNLIEAAPDMFRALKNLVDQALEKYPHFEDTRGQANIERAVKALYKAAGIPRS